MTEHLPPDGAVYLASDGRWYRWPTPTPYDTEAEAHASPGARPIFEAPPPAAAPYVPAVEAGVHDTAAPEPEPEPEPEPQPEPPPAAAWEPPPAGLLPQPGAQTFVALPYDPDAGQKKGFLSGLRGKKK